jgi:hypothetical protein
MIQFTARAAPRRLAAAKQMLLQSCCRSGSWRHVEAKGCGSEEGLELKRMMVLK